MAGLGLDADEGGRVPGLGGLEGGGEFEGVAGHDPVVVIPGGDQGGGVGGPRLEVVEGRIGQEGAGTPPGFRRCRSR